MNLKKGYVLEKAFSLRMLGLCFSENAFKCPELDIL